MQQLLYGEMEGPKAGPYRWVFADRNVLLDVWEWKSFHAVAWMLPIMGVVAAHAAASFPDLEVSPPPLTSQPTSSSICVCAPLLRLPRAAFGLKLTNQQIASNTVLAWGTARWRSG